MNLVFSKLPHVFNCNSNSIWPRRVSSIMCKARRKLFQSELFIKDFLCDFSVSKHFLNMTNISRLISTI